jgi:hypothetical protein
MAREEKKRVELRTVDDEVAPLAKVVRLDNRETERNPKDETPIRLGPIEPSREPSRLDLPSRDEIELRTHQPGIDALFDIETAGPDPTEEGWGDSAARRHPIPWGWFALIGLAIAAAVVWSLTHLEKAEVQADQIRVETESVLAKEEREEREARKLVERIETTLRTFFSATSVESLARSVRQPERVVPLMWKYYAQNPMVFNPLRSVRILQPVTLDNRANFWMTSVVLANGQHRNLVIEIDASGNPLIDWETMVCDQPMPWDEFARERPAGRSLDFRVYVERDMFFSHEFADASRWLCFRLTALDSDETLFGYVSVDSGEARTLLHLIEMNGGRKTSLILRLGIPEGLQSHSGVVIEKVVASRWLYIDPPDPAS